MSKNKHFQSRYRGTPTFNCYICGHLTRLSGQENHSLCSPCFDLAGQENAVFDGCADQGTVNERERLLTKIIKRGGSVVAVKKHFSELFQFKA